MNLNYSDPIGSISTLPPSTNQLIIKDMNNNEWWLCDGRSFDSSLYPELFQVLNTIERTQPANTIPDLLGRSIAKVANSGATPPGSMPNHYIKVEENRGKTFFDYLEEPWDERTGFPKNKLRRISV